MTSAPPDRGVAHQAAEDPLVAANRMVSRQATLAIAAIGAIASQAALLTALLYYVGWARTNATLGYFGVDPKIIGYSTEDYLLRSSNTAFTLVIIGTLAGLGLLTLNRTVLEPRARAGDPRMLRCLRAGLAIGVLLAVVVCLRLAAPGIVAYPGGLLLPVCLVVSIALMAYGGHLRALYPPDADSQAGGPRAGPPQADGQSRVRSTALLGLGIVAVLWLSAQYAHEVGERRGERIAAGLARDPEVTVYSSAPLAIRGPGVRVGSIGTEGDRYRHAYSGLRLLASGNGRIILLGRGWRRGEQVHILPDDGSFRLDIAPR